MPDQEAPIVHAKRSGTGISMEKVQSSSRKAASVKQRELHHAPISLNVPIEVCHCCGGGGGGGGKRVSDRARTAKGLGLRTVGVEVSEV